MSRPSKHGGWGNVWQPTPKPGPTKFELHVQKLGLQEHEWLQSDRLRAWVSKYKHHRYVPENLLIAWGMHDDDLPISDVRNSQ